MKEELECVKLVIKGLLFELPEEGKKTFNDFYDKILSEVGGKDDTDEEEYTIKRIATILLALELIANQVGMGR